MAKKTASEDKGITPEELSKEFKEYSVAEFFKRNRQMLGYTGKVRSLTTVVHEYVTNSLDACEDARVLPDILVEITELPDGHFKVAAEDNGTGIPKPNIGQALGQLLSGTKFMQRQQKRGQQGIGACMRSDTLIPLADGRVLPIKEIVDGNMAGENVLALDLETLKLVKAPIKACIRVLNPHFIRVRTQKGREIFLTPENPVLTVKDGKPEWVRADALRLGERIAAPVILRKFSEEQRPLTLSLLNDDSLEVDNPELMRQLREALKTKVGGFNKISKATGIKKDTLRNWFARRMPNGNSRGKPTIRQLLFLARLGGMEECAVVENIARVGRMGTFINIPTRVNEDIYWLAGLLAGDGHITRKEDNKWGTGISVTGNEKEIIDKFCAKMHEQFGVSYSVLYDEKKHYFFAQTSSAVAAKLFGKLGIKPGRKARTFDIPNSVLSASDELLGAYIKGLFDADGSVVRRNRSAMLAIYNKPALEKIVLALLRLGIASSLNKMGGNWRVMVCGKENLERFAQKVGLSNPAKMQLLNQAISSIGKERYPTQVVPGIGGLVLSISRENDVRPYSIPSAARSALKTNVFSKHALRQIALALDGKQGAAEIERWAEAEVDWLEVREIELIDNPEEFVYDLEVEGHHNFVAGGIIAHNSYCTLFSQITTGKETRVKTSVGDYKVYECDVSIDINKNTPAIRNEREYSGKFKGTRIETELAEVEYNRSAFGVYEYLRRTAIANPHAQITLVEPNKEITVFPRATKEIPKMPKKVLPHPLGITTSDLVDMAGATDARKIGSFLEKEFSRVSSDRVAEIQSLMPKDPKTQKPLCDFDRSPKSLQWAEAEKIVESIQKIKWIAPESDSLQPIGAKELEKSLKNLLAPEELRVIERPPKVFRGGISFMVEAAVAYGGKAGAAANQQNGNGNAGVPGAETRGEAMRFANRVPLLFDAGACAITEAVKTVDWARYDLKDWENLPVSIFVNFTSVYVPYTGAGKLAISAEEEIVTEIRQALMEAGRGVAIYLREMRRAEEQEHRRSLFFRYINEVAQCLHDVTGTEKAVLAAKLKKLAEENTSLLEAREAEDEEGLEELEKAAEKEMKGERGEE